MQVLLVFPCIHQVKYRGIQWNETKFGVLSNQDFPQITFKLEFKGSQVCSETLWNILLLVLSESPTSSQNHALPPQHVLVCCCGTCPNTCLNIRGDIQVIARVNPPQRELTTQWG